MSGERCDCCDLPVISCGRFVEQQLRQETAQERARLAGLPGVFLAVFSGACATCGERITPGDTIRRAGNASGYTGECCL